ncbi:MAG: bifunctional demethylmenaquinone methyltransferase/2-methoxy-6-polyprenyl-1,4-benzoquinol methylase UbiE [Bdellovibrio sp.]
MNFFEAPEAKRVQDIFSRVASRYDLANDVLSLGIHRLWKNKLVQKVPPNTSLRVLDCATGTGDLAKAWKQHLGPHSTVVATDFNPEMLRLGPEKAKGFNIDFQIADVLDLPFPDASFDVVSISFGIRNVSDPQKGLGELARVLKPGGQLLVLEFGQPQNLLSYPYRLYSQRILPRIGGWLTRAPDAYQYLERSSAQFPCGENFVQWIQASARFDKVSFERLSFGIAYLYCAKTENPSQTESNKACS